MPLSAVNPTLQKVHNGTKSDHSIFIQNGRPAIANTSANFMALSTQITHMEKDTIDLVDFHQLAEIAHGLYNLIHHLYRENHDDAFGN
jgi:hypothetical protein